MDRKEEYHDPDYPGTSGGVKNDRTSLSEDEKLEKIKRVICREFTNELDIRENELMLIDQRMSTSRRMLHRLRYSLVSGYYCDQKLQLTNSHIQDEVAAQNEPRARAEVTSLLRDGQRRLHPSVRKLLGKQSVDLAEILLRSRAPRTKARKDYSAMVRCKNYTIPADTTKSLRPDANMYSDVVKVHSTASRPKRQPRHFDPKITKVVTLDEATRNQMKYRYRIIIGNTSKYAPPASRADRSTHKWLLYVRGPPHAPDVSPLVTGVTVRLHHSYAPHHTVHIDKPPFHMSRRGWGEFPAKVELHFALAERNRPATVEHTIKLDRNYTGLQTLGAETVVDVWLYSTQEMLTHEYKEEIYEDQSLDTLPDIPTDVPSDLTPDLANSESVEPIEPEPVNEIESESNGQTDSWLDFFSRDTTELDVDEMIIKPVKKAEEKINDLESLIETNVINKDVVKEDEIETETVSESVLEEQIIETVNEVEDNPITYKSVEIQEDLPNELLSQPTSPRKRIMKYMDPTTGRIYYLEMDRNLDLSKVQEIVINSKGNIKTAKISPIKPNGLKNVRRNAKKGGVSLLKPEVKNQLKTENNSTKSDKQKSVLKRNYTHIENDHCYLGSAWSKSVNFTQNLNHNSTLPEIHGIDYIDDVVIKKEQSVYECLCDSLSRFSCVRVAVNYLLKKMPLMTEQARDPDYVKNFPYVVETDERFWRFEFAKRRNIEWSRAKLINKLLTEHLNTHNEPIWRTKQILIYSRMHGFYPVRPETVLQPSEPRTENEWSSWTDLENRRTSESSIKEFYPRASDICSLTVFDSAAYTTDLSDSIEITESDDELEIVNEVPVKMKKEIAESSSNLTLLPVESEEDRLRFLFIEKKSADIGVELRNEDVGSGYCYSAVHAVMLSAVKNFAEELIRSALAAKLCEAVSPDTPPPVWVGSPPPRAPLAPAHVYRGARAPRLRVLRARGLGAEPRAPRHL